MLFPPDVLVLVLASIGDEHFDDTAIAGRIRNGDHEAFRLFFEKYHPALLGYLLRRGIDEESARDIIQQAFLYIWEKRSTIDTDKSLRAYLFRIGSSRGLNLVRDSRKFDEAPLSRDLPFDTSADEETHENDVMDSLSLAIQALPDKRREVFELCFMQQLSYKEAAEIMDVSVKTIENHMALALKDIRSKMKKFYNG